MARGGRGTRSLRLTTLRRQASHDELSESSGRGNFLTRPEQRQLQRSGESYAPQSTWVLTSTVLTWSRPLHEFLYHRGRQGFMCDCDSPRQRRHPRGRPVMGLGLLFPLLRSPRCKAIHQNDHHIKVNHACSPLILFRTSPAGRKPCFGRGGRGRRTAAETAATPWESEDSRLDAEEPRLMSSRYRSFRMR